MRTSFSATEQDAIRRDHRAMETAGVSMVDLLTGLPRLGERGAIGITALAGDIDSLALGGGHAAQDPDTTSGLIFGYKAFRFGNGLINVTVVAGTLTLPSSTTNYVEVDRAGTVSNTSGFTSGRLPLWTIVTGASAISDRHDLQAAAAADRHWPAWWGRCSPPRPRPRRSRSRWATSRRRPTSP
jgi:hypothetical protein